MELKDLKAFNDAAIEADKATAKDLLAGGVAPLVRLQELFKADRKGFEEQVFSGRSSVMDPKIDELIALRAYAERWIGRLQFYIELETAGTTSKEALDKKQ